MADLLSYLTPLLDAPGLPGSEDAAAAVLRGLLPAGTVCETPRGGGLIAYLPHKDPDAPLLLLDAHLDEIGLIVTGAEENGFLRFAAVGGVDARVLPNASVTVLCDPPVSGVITCVPPHLLTDAKKTANYAIDALYIDTGRTDIGVLAPPGTYVRLDGALRPLTNGWYSARALDNRLSLAVILSALCGLDTASFNYRIAFTATAQEEVGGRGAITAAYALNPHAAIVLDVTFASGPAAPEHGTFPPDQPTLCIGPETDRRLNDLFFRAGEAVGIPLSREVYGGRTGTNGTNIQSARCGVPLSVLSVPVRNMHTPVEAFRLETAEATAQLLRQFLETLQGGDLL